MRIVVLLALGLLGCTGTEGPDKGGDTLMDTEVPIDADADGVVAANDCDDTDPEVYPGALERCDGKDNDCDNRVDDDDDDLDERSAVEAFADRDRDGVGDASLGFFCIPPNNSADVGGDCDDGERAAFPGNTEICDEIDNDCDGLIDDADDDLDAASARTWFSDLDGDGEGDANAQSRTCTAPAGGAVTNARDCDDGNAAVNSLADEVCDGVDNDCDGDTDVDDADLPAGAVTTWFLDADLDGYGSPAGTLQACADPGPGWEISATDCDDSDEDVSPAAPEVCDEVDNDCDDDLDDDDPSLDPTSRYTWYRDGDLDGFGDPDHASRSCAPPSRGVMLGGDCDDADDGVYPGAVEVCDGTDNDCDGDVDDADADLDVRSATTWYRDNDGDGFGASGPTVVSCAQPPNRVDNDGDCNDSQRLAWTGAVEVCDGVDNDCAGGTDDADAALDLSSATTWYADGDGDGFGDPNNRVRTCVAPSGTVATGGDCNDSDPLAWTGAPEVCDGVDNNCVAGIDDADPALDTSTAETWYADLDGDTYGDPGRRLLACVRPASASVRAGDCNDDEPLAWAGADEVCDGVDNDCMNGTDDADPSVDLSTALLYYLDSDGDGFGASGVGQRFCTPPAGVAAVAGDCDDDNAVVYPGGTEVCDGADNDCDQLTDLDDDSLDITTAVRGYADNDGDGYGDPNATSLFCVLPTGAIRRGGDCNDNAATAYPGAPEVCDGIDNDCDPAGLVDDDDPNVIQTSVRTWYADGDRDGYGAGAGFQACNAAPQGSIRRGDCDDGNANIHPGAAEVCDGDDNDCDGITDPDSSWWDARWPYRVLLSVTAPSTGASSPPVAVDVDFGALLDQVVDSSGLDVASVRVVHQACSTGQPVLPSEFIDGVAGVFERGDLRRFGGDDDGAVVFLLDADGDYATADPLPGGVTVNLGLYFASGGTSSGLPVASGATSLVADSDGDVGELSNALTEAVFEGSQGGLATTLRAIGYPSTGDQTSTDQGNGMFLGEPGGSGGDWVGAADDSSATLQLVHAGPVFGALRAEGTVSNPWGGFDYSYTYFLFEGRPELYAQVRFTIDRATRIGPQGQFWGVAVRPFLVNNNGLSLPAPSDGDGDVPGYAWARGNYQVTGATYGIAAGYRVSPALRSRPVFQAAGNSAGQWVGLVGQDVEPIYVGGVDYYDAVAGERIVDDTVVVIYPHGGTFGGVSADFFGSLEGTLPVLGLLETVP